MARTIHPHIDRIQLLTSLTPAECASRLMEAIDTERSALFSFAGIIGSKPVIGWVSESSVRLRKRIGYSNSFQSFLTATMHRTAGGTFISGQVAMHPFVRVFLFMWIGGVILIGGPTFLNAIGLMISGSGSEQQNVWLGAVVTPLMLALGYGLARFGRHLARHESQYLADFLIRTLDAHEQD